MKVAKHIANFETIHTYSRSLEKKCKLAWIPLQKHPQFWDNIVYGQPLLSGRRSFTFQSTNLLNRKNVLEIIYIVENFRKKMQSGINSSPLSEEINQNITMKNILKKLKFLHYNKNILCNSIACSTCTWELKKKTMYLRSLHKAV